METSGMTEATETGGAETVATREWVIRDIDADGVLVDRLPDGGRARLDRDLLPDDVAEGDRFRVVAQVDRRGRRAGHGSTAAADPARGEVAGARGGEPGADASGVPAGSDLPDAMHEALRNLT